MNIFCFLLRKILTAQGNVAGHTIIPVILTNRNIKPMIKGFLHTVRLQSYMKVISITQVNATNTKTQEN